MLMHERNKHPVGACHSKSKKLMSLAEKICNRYLSLFQNFQVWSDTRAYRAFLLLSSLCVPQHIWRFKRWPKAICQQCRMANFLYQLWLLTYALSFYKSKIILDLCKLLWTVPKQFFNFDMIQKVKFIPNFELLITIRTCAKQFGRIQNRL